MSYRIYLDYNVIEDLSKERIPLPEGNYDIFCSVAHGEEYYNACCNATEEYKKAALKVKETLTTISKKGIVLNPEKNGIRAKPEKFDDCIDRIRKNDTRDFVNRNGSLMYQNNKEAVSKLKRLDVESVNNSNLTYDKIWLRPEVIERLGLFQNWYKNYDAASGYALLKAYGFKSFLLDKSNTKLPKEFNLERDCFKKEYSFALLEMVMEFLNNDVLCTCGYCKDKTERTTQSGIHDVSHMIYATYCNFFVSKDANLVKRAKAIYYYLGLNTRAICLNEWLDMDLTKNSILSDVY